MDPAVCLGFRGVDGRVPVFNLPNSTAPRFGRCSRLSGIHQPIDKRPIEALELIGGGTGSAVKCKDRT